MCLDDVQIYSGGHWEGGGGGAREQQFPKNFWHIV